MPRAIWNDAILAESDETVLVEGNHYFPPDSVNWEYFEENTHSSICPWKGQASYYDVKVGDRVNRNAAWFYAEPSRAARHIKGHIAFWNGVKVVRGDAGEGTKSSRSGLLGNLLG